uniref:Odorant receptor 1b n=2 Tax=Sirex TaxID=36764 RepID=A0A857N2J0_9HYME|nr:odorant receptor 1b [Sirex nitobei]
MNIKCERERQVMLKNAKIGRMLSIGCTVLILIAVGTYIIIHVYANMQPQAKNVTNSTLQLLYRAYFPFDTKKSPNYELACIIQSVGAAYAAVSYSAIDTLIAMLILHLCAQLTNLQYKLKNLISEVEYGKEMKFREKLAVIVNRHEHLNRFAESMEESFNALLLVHMLFCTLQFCFLSYSLLSAIDNGEKDQLSLYQLPSFIIYVISSLLQLFIYCYVGEKLEIESTELSYAAYQCEWYTLSSQETRDLIFVMSRAKIPLGITAGKFCSFSYLLFSNVLKTSMGYLSVLLTIRD